jgi:hypothetical protein
MRKNVLIQQDIQRVERETVEHRQQTNAGIHNDRYLTLTGQADYLYDPNFDSNTNRTDFKRSAVRERP